MIYYVRHGQTNYNKKSLIQGTINSTLNEIGITQAKSHAEELKDVKLDYIFCSPLKRTYQTAEIINKYHNLPILKDFRLTEIYMGSLQGKSGKNLDYNEVFKNFHKFGAETREFTYHRIYDFINYIKHNYQGKNILIVSHSGIFNMFHLIMNNKDLIDFKPENLKNDEIKIYKN